MSHGTLILFNMSFWKLSELSPSWVLNVTEILEKLETRTGKQNMQTDYHKLQTTCRIAAARAATTGWRCKYFGETSCTFKKENYVYNKHVIHFFLTHLSPLIYWLYTFTTLDILIV